MGKSRTSPLQKTSSGIGVGGIGVSGGVGVSKTTSTTTQTQVQQATPQQQNQVTQQTSVDDLIEASQIGSIYGNNTVSMFANMSDDQMAKAVSSSIDVDIPYHLADAKNTTQEFVFANGLNAKPTVLSDADFDDYIKQNKIGSKEYLIREVDPVQFSSNGVGFSYTPDDITDMFKTSDVNYIGGKQRGHVYGYGTYFGMGDFNHVTGYGSGADGVGHKSMIAVFDKSKARAIYSGDIHNQWSTFSKTHQKTARVVNGLNGDKSSIKALLMGYNVITTNSKGSLIGATDEYYNVIDRSALVVRASNRK